MIRRPFAAAALAALAVAAALARAEDVPAPAPGIPEKPAGVVKLALDETLDGKPNRDTPITYFLRKKLREAGYVAWTEKPLRADEHAKRQREKDVKAGKIPASATATADVNDHRPAPDLVITGTIDVGVGSTSTFYGQTVATMYVGQGRLSIKDPAGKELGVVEEKDEWGKTKAKDAREECIRRTQAWLAAALLKSEPIHARFTEKDRAVVDKWIADTEKKKQKKDAGEGGGAGEGGSEEKK